MIILYQYISRELLELEIAQYRDSDGINITQLWSWSQYDSTITHLAPVIVGECNVEILIVLLSKYWLYYYHPSSSYDHFISVHFQRTSRARDCTICRDSDGINITQLWSWSQYDSTITHLAPVIVGECSIEILIVLLSPSSSYDHFISVHFQRTSRARDCTTSR